MSDSYHFPFTIDSAMLSPETTVEYYMGNDPDIYYCEDHETLIVVKDYEDRVLLTGLSKDTMFKFAQKLYKQQLDKAAEDAKLKDAGEKEPVPNMDFE